ncbi:unnamed protein product [Darwinula stevensoni]|uniref:Uncharacterized protein n=1 Tax=Darwinula stevensoni TaxID=69355 RepID=A0A7R8XFR9_9CRUS|nr:unnamed protein product [Darwinula stevensoni]CAG0895779.1 unnamed protein product [Darwinula stevensoni]
MPGVEMSTKNRLTKELKDSVKNCLGKNVKVTLQALVKMETKGDKTDPRVLIDFHFHYLDIYAIESKKPTQLTLVVGEKSHTFHSMEEGSLEVDTMVVCLGTAVKAIFPTIPLEHIIRRIDVVPQKRIQRMHDHNKQLEEKCTRELSACGGYSMQYACMCDYHGLPYREEVAWDVDTIYLSHNTRELCLKDFDHLDPKDLIPIVSALELNTWFSKFQCSGLRLSHEVMERLVQVLKRSLSLEELHMANVGLKVDMVHKLSMAILENHSTRLHTLDLSHNMVEDKGVSHLLSPVSSVPAGLKHLNLSHCGMSSKGINQLSHALSINPLTNSSLTFLDLSGNSLKDDAANLCSFLAQPNAISHLDLSGTDCSLEALFGALLRGCTTKLNYLNISKNSFSTKKGKEIPPSFKLFLSSTLAMRQLIMTSCRLANDSLKQLLLGLASNGSACEVHLDISCNGLGSNGASLLESCLPEIACLQSLDVSENGLEGDMAGVVSSVSKNKSMKTLNIGRNVNTMKSKHVGHVIEALVQLVQDDDCVLESLSVADSRLKSDIYNLINALGSNHCLQSIDLSGNAIGDPGARLLAKALQINSKLQTVVFDRNNIGLQGFQDIAYAMESNYTVKHMPYPVYDVMVCMKTAPDKSEAVMKKIQDLLQRNVSPKKYSNGQAFRLQQGFLLSSTQQMVDRLVVQTQETIRILRQQSDSVSLSDIEEAERLIPDAENSKQLLTRLHEVVLKEEEGGNPVSAKLNHMAEELQGTISKFLQQTMDSMLKCAEGECPHIMGSAHTVGLELQKYTQHKGILSPDVVKSCLVDQAGTDIINRVKLSRGAILSIATLFSSFSEVNSSVAAHLSDRIVDEVIESLSRSYKALSKGVNGSEPLSLSRSLPPHTSNHPMGLSYSSGITRSASQFSEQSQKSDGSSPGATPQLSAKRKSLHGRKLRPQSVVDVVEGISGEELPRLLPPVTPEESDESLDTVTELPSASGQLQHLGKARPKRAKTRAPTRTFLTGSIYTDDDQEHNLQEGLDEFFHPTAGSAPASPVGSPTFDNRHDPLKYSIPRLVKSTSNSTENSPTHVLKVDEKSGKDRKSDTESSCSDCSLLRRGSDKQPQKKEKSGSSMVRGISSVFSKAADMVHRSKAPVVSKNDTSPNVPKKEREKEKEKEEKEKEKIEVNPESDRGRNNASSSPDWSESGDVKMRKQNAPHRMGISMGGNIMAEMKARQEKMASRQVIPEEAQGHDNTSGPGPSFRLRPTGLADSLKSPTNGYPKTGLGETIHDASPSPDVPSRPISKTPEPVPLGKGSNQISSGRPRPPPVAPKPRPKSMAGLDSTRSGDLSDASSSNTSTANTPESGDALQDSIDSGHVGSRDSFPEKKLAYLDQSFLRSSPTPDSGPKCVVLGKMSQCWSYELMQKCKIYLSVIWTDMIPKVLIYHLTLPLELKETSVDEEDLEGSHTSSNSKEGESRSNNPRTHILSRLSSASNPPTPMSHQEFFSDDVVNV